jgi:hypothetical protein
MDYKSASIHSIFRMISLIIRVYYLIHAIISKNYKRFDAKQTNTINERLISFGWVEG